MNTPLPDADLLDTTEIRQAELRRIRPNVGPDREGRAAEQALNDSVRDLSPPLSALCLSGGGIRSASFALGIVQGLARAGLLSQFDYLSTVSGGGYTGGWLSAWIHRAGGEIESILPDLAGDEEPPAVAHIRRHCRYLSPRTLKEAVKLGAVTLRNVFLHWVLLLPLFILIVMTPRIVVSLVAHPPQVVREASGVLIALRGCALCLGVLAVAWAVARRPHLTEQHEGRRPILLRFMLPGFAALLCFTVAHSWTDLPLESRWQSFVMFVTLMCATYGGGFAGGFLTSMAHRVNSSSPPGFSVWLAAAFLLACVPAAAILASSAASLFPTSAQQPVLYVLSVPPLFVVTASVHAFLFVLLARRQMSVADREWVLRLTLWALLLAAVWIGGCFLVFYISGAVLAFRPWVVTITLLGMSLCALIVVTATVFARVPLASFIQKLAFGLLVCTLVIVLTAVFDWVLGAFSAPLRSLEHRALLQTTAPGTIVLTALIFAVVTLVLGLRLDINDLGLGGHYRACLVRAFLGASEDPPMAETKRHALNAADLRIHDLSPNHRPFPVVNTTVNLVSAAGDESQLMHMHNQPKPRECFTLTPLHAGSPGLGYRPANTFAEGMTLGTAVATSGAAVTPLNLGAARPSAPVSFMLSALAVRLGRWVGNPRSGSTTWRSRGPYWALAPLANEAFGLTDARNPYVYLSDGGHYDNLGVYAMLIRRCRLIVISDAGQDEDSVFEDLGVVIRRINVDFGIRIEIDVRALRDRHRRWALGRICFDDGGPDGTLLYLKAAIVGDEPQSLREYAQQNPPFPHHATTDQWYDDQRFDNYRALGLHTIESLTRGRTERLSGWLQHLSACAAATGLTGAPS